MPVILIAAVILVGLAIRVFYAWVLQYMPASDHGIVGLCSQFAPLGPRIDCWLRPGRENVIDLYGRISDHTAGKDSALNFNTQSIRLELY